MEFFVNIARGLFLLITVLVVGTAVIGMFSGADGTFSLIYIVLGVSCIGVITTWKVQK